MGREYVYHVCVLTLMGAVPNGGIPNGKALDSRGQRMSTRGGAQCKGPGFISSHL